MGTGIIKEIMENDSILNVYKYGSFVYGTNRPDSDEDFIIIVKNGTKIDEPQINFLDNDFTILTEEDWFKMISDNHIVALECCSLSGDNIIKETVKYQYKFDLIATRIAVSAVVSNSWVKAKKKLVVPEDFNPLIAKKSLWHCFRILMFGIQACKHGKVVDFTEANDMYDEIMNGGNDWDYYKNRYQGSFNALKSEFKKYSEKEWVKFKNETK